MTLREQDKRLHEALGCIVSALKYPSIALLDIDSAILHLKQAREIAIQLDPEGLDYDRDYAQQTAEARRSCTNHPVKEEA